MTKIVAFAGKIGAGKTTLRNFLYGYMMKHYVPSLINDIDGMIDTYQITAEGHLLVPGETDGVVEMGVFDTNSRDPDVVSFMRKHIWPYVKHFSFAGRLKEIALDFGFSEESLYGTQEQKKAPTDFMWENMAGVITPAEAMKICEDMRSTRFVRPIKNQDGTETEPQYSFLMPYDPGKPDLWCSFPDASIWVKEGPMSSRDFLQYFGTEVCRRFNPLIWANSCIKEIAQWQPHLAVIDDLRFSDTELPVVQANEGVAYYLTRDSMKDYQSPHGSEEGIHAEDCDVIVDNEAMTIEESCLFVLEDMRKRGIIE